MRAEEFDPARTETMREAEASEVLALTESIEPPIATRREASLVIPTTRDAPIPITGDDVMPTIRDEVIPMMRDGWSDFMAVPLLTFRTKNENRKKKQNVNCEDS